MVSYLFKFNKKIEKNLQTAKNLINTGKISIEDHIITTNDDELKEDNNEIFCKSICKCDLCESVNTINDKWNNWIPQTPLEKSLKKNIDEIPTIDP